MECFWSHLEFNGLILSVKWGITNLDAESLCQVALVVYPWIALKGVKHGGIHVAGGWIAHEIQSSCRSRGTESRCWPVRVKLSGLKVGKVKRAHLWDFQGSYTEVWKIKSPLISTLMSMRKFCFKSNVLTVKNNVYIFATFLPKFWVKLHPKKRVIATFATKKRVITTFATNKRVIATFAKHSEFLPEVCLWNPKNSEILSKLRNSELCGASDPYPTLYYINCSYSTIIRSRFECKILSWNESKSMFTWEWAQFAHRHSGGWPEK